MAVETGQQEKRNTENFFSTGEALSQTYIEPNEVAAQNARNRAQSTPEQKRIRRRNNAISNAIYDGETIGADSSEVKKRVQTSHSNIDPERAEVWIDLYQNKKQEEPIPTI